MFAGGSMLNTGSWLRASACATALLAGTAAAAPVAAQPVEAGEAQGGAQAAARFEVRAIQVKGATLLPAEVIEDAVYPFTGPDRTADDIEKARAALQKAFEQHGYGAVTVSIPEQSVEGGIIRLEAQSQTIGRVEVAGGIRTSRDWVLSRAPSLRPGGAPNFSDVQRDIVALNVSADRRITPEVKAGAAPGTIDVVLNVEDRTPFHATAELNNFSSASTTDLRAAASVRYDNLWGRGDSVSVSTQTAPRRPKDGTVLSVNYLARVGSAQLLGYYVHSDSDISVIGGASVVGKGDLGGVRLIAPLSRSEGFYQSLTVGLDYKNFGEDVALGADRDRAAIRYAPLTLGWRGDWTAGRLKSNLTVTGVFGLRGLGDGLARFDYKRFGASPNFFALKLDGAATADLWRDFKLRLHGVGQWAPDPLISNEGFSLGGMETVRGYYESEALGDYGAALQVELRSPPLAPLGGSLLNDLRLHAFADWGVAGIHRPLAGQRSEYNLGSAGGGLRVRLFDYLNGAVDVGVPLRSGPDTASGDVFTRFRMWGEF